MKFAFFRNIFEKFSNINFMKIRPMEAELLHADKETDRHDETKGRFSQFCQSD